MISRKLPAQNTTAAPACPDFSHGSAGKICPSSGNTLMTSLEKHHLAALVNENKKAQLTWLTLVITAIQVWVGVFSPRTVVEYLRKHKSCFPGRNPTLLLARGRWPQITRGCLRERSCIPPLPAASSCPFPPLGS